MDRGTPLAASKRVCLGLVVLLTLGTSCAQTTRSMRPSEFNFFSEAHPERDPWFHKVAEWQKRANLQNSQETAPALGSDSEGAKMRPEQISKSGLLRLKMGNFAALRKRELAQKINTWTQREARRHYRIEADSNPSESLLIRRAADHWPTFQELLARNGDDCDGLDLINHRLLTEFGFPRNRVYRAVVRRQRDRMNHMVTLWFEDAEDPWVLDATGAMTVSMLRFSEIEGWTPTKVFNEQIQYQVTLRRDSLTLIEN